MRWARKSKIASTSRRTTRAFATTPSGAEADAVAHDVAHERAAVAGRLERVGVVPQRVGPLDLLVDEAIRRLPRRDLRQPADRHAVHAQPVADQRALAHGDRPGRDDAKAQQRGRQRLEVARVGEEPEHLLERAGQALLALKDVLGVHISRYARMHAGRSAPATEDGGSTPPFEVNLPFRSPGRHSTHAGAARTEVGAPAAHTAPYALCMSTGHDLRTATPPPLRDDDHVRGDPAGTLVVFYADFTCPRCALAHERLVDAGARVAFRHLALRAKHPRAIAVALAAEAAAAAGRLLAVRRRALRRPGSPRRPAPVAARPRSGPRPRPLRRRPPCRRRRRSRARGHPRGARRRRHDDAHDVRRREHLSRGSRRRLAGATGLRWRRFVYRSRNKTQVRRPTTGAPEQKDNFI